MYVYVWNLSTYWKVSIVSVDVAVPTQQRQPKKLSFEEMGNELLNAMQGTLICLDNHHIIVDVSKTVKQYFGFEQVCLHEINIIRDALLLIWFSRLKSSAYQSYYLLKTLKGIPFSNFSIVQLSVSKTIPTSTLSVKFSVLNVGKYDPLRIVN